MVDPLLLQPAQDPAVSFWREGFVVHSVEKARPEKVEAELLVPGGQSPPAPSCIAPRRLEDSRTRRPLLQESVHDGAA